MSSSFTLCDPCKTGEDIETIAVFYCQECKDGREFHRKVSITRNDHASRKDECKDGREFRRKVSITRNHHASRKDESKTVSHKSGKINELSKTISIITESGATGHTNAGQSMDTITPFTTATLTNQFNASLEDDQKNVLYSRCTRSK